MVDRKSSSDESVDEQLFFNHFLANGNNGVDNSVLPYIYDEFVSSDDDDNCGFISVSATC
jgi:hypothetical protein